ncbi:deoxyribodipyrimidine photo-lyase [Myroides odoratus]|uniref:cryptochrome/photolyase family protein n=1 Tax=Myroides odoratus TaxID=256 RepID=UPI00333F648F
MEEIVIFWFRRDIRLHDNVGLYHAIQSGKKVLPIFIFDPVILAQFPAQDDRRIPYIYQALAQVNRHLQQLNSQVVCYHDHVLDVFKQLMQTYTVSAVYTNADYEPAARKRDAAVQALVAEHAIAFYAYKDQVIFEANELLKSDQTPYKVYTPYSKLWRSRLTEQHLLTWTLELKADYFVAQKEHQIMPSLTQLGYKEEAKSRFEAPLFDSFLIQNYTANRDFPALDATTRLGIALRFGTVSIRACVRQALHDNDTWLSQLIWRDFFMAILYHYPHSARACFKREYENIQWRNNEVEFEAWCKGETGYPLVDAGMRELNQTGYMHNRVRMVVASFLVKHLLIDWRWGEAYFAQQLNDYDLALNVGNWQWAAGCGCDAAPYFRVFNPTEQQKKFDKDFNYIKKWIPQYDESTYITPIVEHKLARERALLAFKQALK